MKKSLLLILLAFSYINIYAQDCEPCTEVANNAVLSTFFGITPCVDQCGTPISPVTFEAWGNEAYAFDSLTPEVEYTFSICDGYDAANWEAVLTVTDGFDVLECAEGCTVTFTATETQALVFVSVAGDCGGDYLQVNNGSASIACTGEGPVPNCADCCTNASLDLYTVDQVTDLILDGAPNPLCDATGTVYTSANFTAPGETEAWQAFKSEAYTLPLVSSLIYEISLCNGPDANSWPVEITIESDAGEVICTDEDCSLEFSPPISGNYIVYINEVGNCGSTASNGPNGYFQIEILESNCLEVECPVLLQAASGSAPLCSGSSPNNTIDLEATLGLAYENTSPISNVVKWFVDESLTLEANVDNFSHTGNDLCEPELKTFYLGLFCFVEQSSIPAGVVDLNIYPPFEQTLLISSTPEQCELPTVSSLCANYIIEESNIPDEIYPGDSGIASWAISYNGANGTSCFNQLYSLPYDCVVNNEDLQNSLSLRAVQNSPSSLQLLLNSPKPQEVSFQLFHINGQTALKSTDLYLNGGAQSIPMEVEPLAAGIYLIQVRGESFIMTQKVMLF